MRTDFNISLAIVKTVEVTFKANPVIFEGNSKATANRNITKHKIRSFFINIFGLLDFNYFLRFFILFSASRRFFNSVISFLISLSISFGLSPLISLVSLDFFSPFDFLRFKDNL